MTPNFLEPDVLRRGGPRRFNAAVERLLWHLGFDDVRLIDGSGDEGGDILCVKDGRRFVFQNKWTTRASIDRAGVDEVERAQTRYSADRAVLVTNSAPSDGAIARKDELARIGVQVEIWNGVHLRRLFEAIPEYVPSRYKLYRYQDCAIRRICEDLASKGRALLVLATGLGKTVVGGEVIRELITKGDAKDVLVVAHMRELVEQLEKAMWRHLPKTVPTQLLTGEFRPSSLAGVTCATVESALSAAYDGYRPQLVMVDETHHVGERGTYQRLLDLLQSSRQFGVTATPWRADAYDIARRFGDPSFKMGIAEGLQAGFLAQVNYSLFIDDVNWEVVRAASRKGYSIKELNERLFLPQRDEAVIEHLINVWSRVADPRAIIFCETIEHAERMKDLLVQASPNWRNAKCIHSDLPRRDRQLVMADFRAGRVGIITVRDIFNEGVDVPDVNIIAFLRVTHSRRIFVQQLGRGLRVRPGKECVHVLDFTTDIRRVAATLALRREMGALSNSPETVVAPQLSTIRFTNENVGRLMDAWVIDAANLETASDEAKLQFPDAPFDIS